MKLHPSLTREVILDGVRYLSVGFCINCGTRYYTIDPHTGTHPCSQCHTYSVYCADELLVYV